MVARKVAQPSWAWAGILHGRDVLGEHRVWKVGNGRRIRVFCNAWIPGLPGCHLQRNGDENMEETHIQEVTLEIERQAIQSIYLSNLPAKDRMVWPITKTGVATPKMV